MSGGPPARRFPIALGRRSRPLLRLLFGVTPENAYVDLGDELDAHFGFGRFQTPVSNITDWRIEGPWRWLTAIGIRRGVRDGEFTFGGTHAGGVRVGFRECVRGMRIFCTRALYVTVEDPEGFTAALSELGIPGADRRGR